MRGLFSVIHSRLAKDQRPVEHQQPNQTTHETTSSHLYNVGRFFPDRDRSVFMPLCLHASDSLHDRCGLGHKVRSRVLGRVQLSRVSAWLLGSVVFCAKNWHQITAEGLTCTGRLWAGNVQLGPRICMVSLRASGNRVCGCFFGDSVSLAYFAARA